jgi:hypothetical protein
LNALEAQWLEELRAQEEAQLAQLEQSRRELPLQRRREGSAAVNQTLAQMRSAGQSEREAVRERLLALLRQDFGQDDGVLGITLPPMMSLLGPFPATPPGSSTRTTRRSIARDSMIIETPPWGVASNREISPSSNLLRPLRLQAGSLPGSSAITVPAAPVALSQRNAQISALRAQAIRESRLWTRIVARREGWQLQEVRPKRAQPQAADGTRTVLRILNFA